MRKLALLLASVLIIEATTPCLANAQATEIKEYSTQICTEYTDETVLDEITSEETVTETATEEVDSITDSAKKNAGEVILSDNDVEKLGKVSATNEIECSIDYRERTFETGNGYYLPILIPVPLDKIANSFEVSRITYTVDGGSTEYEVDLVNNAGDNSPVHDYRKEGEVTVAGHYVFGQLKLKNGISAGKHNIAIRCEVKDGKNRNYVLVPKSSLAVNFVANEVNTKRANRNFVVQAGTGYLRLDYLSNEPVNSPAGSIIHISGISFIKDDQVVVRKNLNIEQKVLSNSGESRYVYGVDKTSLLLPEGYIAIFNRNVYITNNSNTTVIDNCGAFDLSDEIKSGVLTEGDYDVLVERSDGSSTKYEKLVTVSSEVKAYDAKILYKGMMHAVSSFGEYIAVIVYGKNITEDIVPRFYDESKNKFITEATPCGYEKVANDGGAIYKLKFVDGAGYSSLGVDENGAAKKVKLSVNGIGLSVSDPNVYLKANPLNISFVEEVKVGKNPYTRFYLDEKKYTAGKKCYAYGSNIYQEFGTAKTATTQVEPATGRVYVDFVGITQNNLYKFKYGTTTDECVYTEHTYDMDTEEYNNFNVPEDIAYWEVHAINEVGHPILSGNSIGDNVLSDEQSKSLEAYHTVRVYYYNKGGTIVESKLVHFYPSGNIPKIVTIQTLPCDGITVLHPSTYDSLLFGSKSLSEKYEVNKVDYRLKVLAESGFELKKVYYSIDGVDQGELAIDSDRVVTIPKEKITGNINIWFTSDAKKYRVTSNSGKFTIGLSTNDLKKSLDVNATAKDAFIFYVYPENGQKIESVRFTFPNSNYPDKKYSVVTYKDDPNKFSIDRYNIANGPINIIVTTAKDNDKANLSGAILDVKFPTSVKKLSNGVYEYNGSEIKPESVNVTLNGATLYENTDYTIEYSSNCKDAGKVIMTVKAIPDSSLYCGSKSYTYTIKGINIADAKKAVISIPASLPWNGSTIEAPVIIKLKASDATLTEGTDYLVLYDNNNNKPGTATATVIGIGGFEGSKEVKYVIKNPNLATDTYTNVGDLAKTIEEAKADGKIFINLTCADYIYTGEAFKPDVIVSYLDANGDMLPLTLGTDYTLKYANNKNASLGQTNVKKLPSVTVTGKGKFKGSKVINFLIRPIDLTDNTNVSVIAPSVKAGKNGKAVTTKPIVSISINGVSRTLKEGTDYEKLTAESYTNNSGTSTRGTVTIKGKKNYAGSVEQTFDIAAKDITSLAKISLPEEYKSAIEYNNTPVVPDPVVKLKSDETPLTAGVDYLVEYINNNKAGTATVRIRGIGEYYGCKNLKFNILQRNISTKANKRDNYEKLIIALDGKTPASIDDDYVLGYEYTGYAFKPAIRIIDSGSNNLELVNGKDYAVKYANNTDVSTSTKKATATITFKGNYKGSVVKKFTISKWSIADENTQIFVEDAIFNNNKAVTTQISVSRNGIAVNPKAIKLVYDSRNIKNTLGENATKDLKVTVSGKKAANIEGNIVKTFMLNEADLNLAVVGKVKAQNYAGKALTPSVTVKYKGVALKKGRDYNLSYVNNDKKGRATINIEAIEGSNFTGNVSTSFIIK